MAKLVAEFGDEAALITEGEGAGVFIGDAHEDGFVGKDGVEAKVGVGEGEVAQPIASRVFHQEGEGWVHP